MSAVYLVCDHCWCLVLFAAGNACSLVCPAAKLEDTPCSVSENHFETSVPDSLKL